MAQAIADEGTPIGSEDLTAEQRALRERGRRVDNLAMATPASDALRGERESERLAKQRERHEMAVADAAQREDDRKKIDQLFAELRASGHVTKDEFKKVLTEHASALISRPRRRPKKKKRWIAPLTQEQREAAKARVAAVQADPAEDRSVYVIGAIGHPVKIGIARNVVSRLSSIQTGCPQRLEILYEIEVGKKARVVERECHRQVANKRLSGEWFDLTPAEAAELVARVVSCT